MAKRKTLVRWQDGTYDVHLPKCESCGVDHYVAGEEKYREVSKRSSAVRGTTERGSEDMEEQKQKEAVFSNPDSLTTDEGVFWGGGEAYPPASLARLEAAVATLTDRQREVWELIYVKGKAQEEAAKLLGISQPAISEHAATAMAKVRKFMGVKE